MKLLAAFFTFLNNLFSWIRTSHDEKVGREQSIKELNDEINRAIDLAESVPTVPDPARDEQLRNRFDRSKRVSP